MATYIERPLSAQEIAAYVRSRGPIERVAFERFHDSQQYVGHVFGAETRAETALSRALRRAAESINKRSEP